MENVLPRFQPVRFGAFEVDLRAGELRKAGLRIKLQEQPLQILAMLLEHPGQVVTREELRKRLWPEDTFVDFDHSLNKAVNKLREALADPVFFESLDHPARQLIDGMGSCVMGFAAASRTDKELENEIKRIVQTVDQ